MDKVSIGEQEFGEWVRIALIHALRETWDGPIPSVSGYSLKLGLLFNRVHSRVPKFWLETPNILAARLICDHPAIVADLCKFDPRAFGFVVRTRLHILASRDQKGAGRK